MAAEVWLLRNKLDPAMNAEEGCCIRAVRRAYAEGAGIPFDHALEPKDIARIARDNSSSTQAAALAAFQRLGVVAGDAMAIRLDNGKTFTINATNNSLNNKYIQSIKLNGKPLDKIWFTHNDVITGGTLELEMGDTPNRKLGTSPESLPPASAANNPASLTKQ